MKIEEPKFHLYYPSKSPCVMHSYNPRNKKKKTKGFFVLAGHPILPNQWIPGLMRDPVSKDKYRTIEEDTRQQPLAYIPLHMCYPNEIKSSRIYKTGGGIWSSSTSWIRSQLSVNGEKLPRPAGREENTVVWVSTNHQDVPHDQASQQKCQW